MMKRVLVFSNEFPPDVGGAGIVAEQNALSLSLNGCEVTVLTRKRTGMNILGLYKIIEVPVFWKLWFLSYRKAVNFESFDLIFLNDIGAVYTAGRYFSNAAFSKSIAFIHGLGPEDLYKGLSLANIFFLFRKTYKLSLNRCKRICAVSHYIKRLFVSQIGMSKFEDKIFVKYAGVDDKIFYPEPDNDFREKWNIPEDAVLLLSVGRINLDKGYYKKFLLFKDLCKEEKLYWVIVGEGEYVEVLQHLAKEGKIDDKIIFVGRKKRNELRMFYSNADIFWLLSKREPFGLVYVEAQMCGIPAIGYNHSGVVEAISDGVSGFLIDNDEQLRTIIKNKLYKKLVKSDIIDFTKKFQIENNIDMFID